MRAMVLTEQRGFELRELPDVHPEPDEVVVAVTSCGVCGSDLHLRHSPVMTAGEVFGHEFSGVVAEVGGNVSGWSAGDPVAVHPFPIREKHDMAAALAGIGCGGGQGALADYVRAGADRLWRLPPGFPVAHGALVEPLAVALHGLAISEVTADDTVAVVGAGPIGVLTALALRARGVEALVAVEPNAERRERMAGYGIPAVDLDDAWGKVVGALGAPPSRVFECAGHPSAAGLAVELVGESGVITLLGMLEEPVTIAQVLLMIKEAQIRASFTYRPRDFDDALGLLVDARIDPALIVTGVEPFTAVEAVMDELATPGTKHVKVLLDVAGA